MKFRQGQVYHIFNQGNNRQRIFFEEENFLYFLQKIRKHLLPYSDILCYCLMPNHFHLLLMPNELAAQQSKAVIPATLNNARATVESKNQEILSQSIGTMLSSYTKAVNRRYQRSGSIFRGKTKVKMVGLMKSYQLKARIKNYSSVLKMIMHFNAFITFIRTL